MTAISEDTITTRSGLQLHVRELRSDDTANLIEIFDHMSSDSRYQRFNQPADNLSEARKWEEAERITRMVPQHSGGLIAFADLAGETAVAVAAARYVCVGDKTAEAAISVADALQGQGVGTELMGRLCEQAKAAGVHWLTATIRNDNTAIWHVLSRMPYAVSRLIEGSDSIVQVDLMQRRSAPAASA